MSGSTNAVYNRLIATAEKRGGGLMLLIDPDKGDPTACATSAEIAEQCSVDAILVGSSTVTSPHFSESVRAIKEVSELPLIIFPGSATQIRAEADAILFTSLISGRNPEYLIGEQVKGAPLVQQFGLEAISTGYMLIESGSLTSVQYVSNSQPIPRDKPDIAVAHALAAQYMGMRCIYLEAGSGARLSVPPKMVEAVVSSVALPLIVGGGLREPEQCREMIEAGASFVVIGNSFEKRNDPHYLTRIAEAVHTKEPIRV